MLRVISGLVAVVACSMGMDALRADPVSILDSSFESVVVETGTANGPGAWGTGGGNGGGAGIYTPASPLPGTDGSRVARVFTRGTTGVYGALFQDIAVIEEGFYYTEFKASQEPGFEPTTSPLRVYFERVPFVSGSQAYVGGDVHAPGLTNSTTMTDLISSATVGPGSSAIGQFLRLVVVVDGDDPGVNVTDPRATYNLDAFKVFRLPLDEGAEPIELAVGDPSFESTPWSRGSGSLGSSGFVRPAAPIFANQQGDQLGYLGVRDRQGSYSALFQDVGTVQAGIYTMTLGAGYDPGFEPTSAGLVLMLEGLGTDGSKVTLGQQVINAGALSSTTLTDVSLTVNIPENSEDIGRTLRLTLVASGQDGANNPEQRATYLIDNVGLDLTAPNSVSGDFDGDGDVDGRDFLVWQRGGSPNALSSGDLALWQNQYGAGSLASVQSVPEPAAFMLACVSVVLVQIGVRWRA